MMFENDLKPGDTVYWFYLVNGSPTCMRKGEFVKPIGCGRVVVRETGAETDEYTVLKRSRVYQTELEYMEAASRPNLSYGSYY